MYWLGGRQTVRDQFGHVVAGCLGVGRGPTDLRPRAEATNAKSRRALLSPGETENRAQKVSSTQ